MHIGLTYWNGTLEQRGQGFDEFERVWEGRPRRCDEELPPEQLLPDDATPKLDNGTE
ncbi:hypothetical protein HBNXHr_2805 [Halorhabdus sp. BNX81]|nr:hypothetical protein HBNXHr_2805 [Halorhabdus sp. BNX81]